MVELTQLWLPILLTAVAVFFLSFAMWMVLPHHRHDWKPAADEDGLMSFLRGQSGGERQISFPYCAEPGQMKDPVWMEKYNKGPKGFLILKADGPESMGKAMGTSFLFNLVTAVCVAYVATMGVPAGADKMFVFRFTATVALLTNSFGLVWGAIWFGRTWSSTLKEMGDGLVYGLSTGAIFMLLWPGITD